jgi:hypothetical protein
LGILGFAALMLSKLDRAALIFEEVLEIFRELADEWASAHFLNHLVVVSA